VRRHSPLRTSPKHYHTMATTQLENLLNTTLGQILHIVRSIQTGLATLDNSNYVLEQLYGIIYKIYYTYCTNSPRSVIIEEICTLVTSDLCETLDITSEYTEHIISQTTRDILDATLQNLQVNRILTSTTNRNKTHKKALTSGALQIPKRKPPTRNAHSVKKSCKETTTTTTYFTMSMKKIRRTLTNILNKISYIAFIAQLGLITSDKTNKALEKH